MDVDAAPRELGGEPVRQDLHIAREDDQIGLGRSDDFPGVSFLLHLGLPRGRQEVKGNVAEVDMGVSVARVVGDDRDRVHLEFAAAPAIEEIDQAVVEARHHQDHALQMIRSTERPCHPEGGRDRLERLAQALDVGVRRGGVEHDPHEEVASLDIVELLGVENVAGAVEQCGRHFRDDPGPVDARQCENVPPARHSRFLF